MLIEFFNTSIEQSFLKALISANQLPKFDFVNDGDLIFENYFYIYQTKIIQCTKTGYLDPINVLVDNSVLGNEVIQDRPRAEFIELDHYYPSTENQNIEFKEFIRASYYSTELHKRFGDYLRFLRDYYFVDLMGMYNCFSYELFNNVSIKSSVKDNQLNLSLNLNQDPTKKVLAIPVRFNQIYTIAINSSLPIYYALVVKFDNKIVSLNSLTNSNFEPKSVGITRFEEPIKISTELTIDQGDAYQYNNQLYLILQIEKTNKSSVVVLEGDYSNSYAIKIVNSNTHKTEKWDTASQEIETEMPKFQKETLSLIYKPKLLQFNTGIQYAYSNTVIPYLVKNVIDNMDVTPENLSYAKKLLGKIDTVNYWSNDIKYLAYQKYLFNTYQFNQDEDGYLIQPKSINYKNNDITGYIDSTIERWVNAKQ